MNPALKKILNNSIIQLPADVLLSIVSNKHNEFITIKNHVRSYLYTSRNWANLFGYKKSQDTYNKKDWEFCSDMKRIKIYHELDDEVFDTGSSNVVCEEICPDKTKLVKLMSGIQYPLMNDSDKPIAVLGIYNVTNGICQLTLDLAVSLTDKEINELLVRRSYKVSLYHRDISLSKREIQCLIGLIKGKHAGEIAMGLNLQQSTVEFYLNNLKDKLGAISKSSLIDTVFQQEIIQQVIL